MNTQAALRAFPPFAALACALLGAPLAASPPYRGPDGETLPFASDEVVLEFLATAEVASLEDIPVGTTRPQRVELEKGGVRARAAFRDVYVLKQVGTWDFVDSYLSEVAAFELARLLEIDHVPPAVVRKVRGKRGSLQLWIEDGMTDADRRSKGIDPPDPQRFERQLEVMGVFDNLVANIDRNPGNILIGPDWKVWFIDHTRSFAGQRELKYPERITGCERGLWHRLQAISDGAIRERLRPYTGRYLGDLLERRRLLVELLRRRIAEQGEDAVLFDGEP